jgi:hypothetical protein
MGLFYAQLKAIDGIVNGMKKYQPQIAFYYAKPSFYHRDLTNPAHPERPLSSPLNQLRSLYESVSLVAGFPAGFVTDERIAAGALDAYKAVFVVEGEYMPKATLAKLKEFAEKGGSLIVIGGFSRFDEYGFTYGTHPGQGMVKSAGGKFTPIAGSIVSASGKPQWIPPCETSIPTYTFTQLEPDVKVLGTYADQKPAVIEHPVGRGRILCVGCPAGVATDAVSGATAEFFTQYLQTLKILPPARTVNYFESPRNDFALMGLTDNEKNDWLILVNAGQYPVNPTIQWSATKFSETQKAIDLLTGQVLPINKTDGGPEFTIRLDPYQVALIGKVTAHR